MNSYFFLVDTSTRQRSGPYPTEASALCETPYLPADCVPGAETWATVVEVARVHADGIPGVVEGYAVERVLAETCPPVESFSVGPFPADLKSRLEEIYALLDTCQVALDPRSQANAARHILQVILWPDLFGRDKSVQP